MSREIKFREWVIGDSDECPSCKPEMRYFALELGENWIEGIFMQFTGLKDKNGEEIYEADILKVKNIGDAWQGDVFYALSAFFVRFNSCNPLDGGVLLHIETDCEVIGNIYENPELLK